MTFKDSSEGTTHYYGDGCGEPAHNMSTPKKTWEKEARKLAETLLSGIQYNDSRDSPEWRVLVLDSAVAYINTYTHNILTTREAETTTFTALPGKDEYWGPWDICDSCKDEQIANSNFCRKCGKKRATTNPEETV